MKLANVCMTFLALGGDKMSNVFFLLFLFSVQLVTLGSSIKILLARDHEYHYNIHECWVNLTHEYPYASGPQAINTTMNLIGAISCFKLHSIFGGVVRKEFELESSN